MGHFLATEAIKKQSILGQANLIHTPHLSNKALYLETGSFSKVVKGVIWDLFGPENMLALKLESGKIWYSD